MFIDKIKLTDEIVESVYDYMKTTELPEKTLHEEVREILDKYLPSEEE